MNKVKENMKNETGSALVLSLMVLIILSVLGGMVGVVTIGSYRLADTTRDSSSAYYIAEAGANMAYGEIKEYVSEAYNTNESKSLFFNEMSSPLGEGNNLNSIVYDNFETNLGEQPLAKVTITPGIENGNSKEFMITSLGDIAGKTRQVHKTFVVTWKPKTPVINIPVFPIDGNPAIIMINQDTNLFLRNNSTVTGDVFHNVKNIDYGPGNDKNHEILTGKEYDIESFNLESIRQYVLNIFSNLELLNSNENLIKKGNVTIKENINKNLIVQGNLIIDNKAIINGNVIVEGTVKMETHTKVKGSIISGGNVEINNQVYVIYDKVTFEDLPFGSNVEVEDSENDLISSEPAIEN